MENNATYINQIPSKIMCMIVLIIYKNSTNKIQTEEEINSNLSFFNCDDEGQEGEGLGVGQPLEEEVDLASIPISSSSYLQIQLYTLYTYVINKSKYIFQD